MVTLFRKTLNINKYLAYFNENKTIRAYILVGLVADVCLETIVTGVAMLVQLQAVRQVVWSLMASPSASVLDLPEDRRILPFDCRRWIRGRLLPFCLNAVCHPSSLMQNCIELCVNLKWHWH